MTEPPAITSGEPAISFGPFRLVAAQRLLLEGDKPVRLGSRAFDILTTLVEHAGEVVGKEELIAPKPYVPRGSKTNSIRIPLGSRTMKWIFGPLPESSGGNSTTTPGQLATRSYKASNPARSATARAR